MARLRPRAILRLQGHDVRLWRRDARLVAEHRAAGSRIIVKDANGRHDVQLALVTTDIAEAVRDAELILCPAPAFAQHDIAGCSRRIWRMARSCFCRRRHSARSSSRRPRTTPAIARRVSFAETGTLPWLTRKHGPFEVAITIRAKRLPVGVFPLKTRRSCARCDRPRLSRRDRALRRRAVGRADECRADHPSAADRDECRPIEHFERWDIHKEGTQASIRRVTDALDAERIAVREGLRLWRPAFSAGASLRQRRRAMDVWPRLA